MENKIKICGWDVGIKHLAYCVIEKEDVGFKIVHWDNIDLTDSEQNKKYCDGFTKKTKKNESKKCNCEAKIVMEEDGKSFYYCKKHIKPEKEENVDIQIKIIEEKYIIKQSNSEESCQYLMPKNKKVCGKKSMYKFDGENCCTNHKNTLLKNFINNSKPKPIKKEKNLLLDPQKLCEKIYDKLNLLEFLKDVKEIYIENQPCLKNPVMKTVASFLFSYFIYLFKSSPIKKKVKFVSPAVKIKINKELLDLVNVKINFHTLNKKINCKCDLCKIETELKVLSQFNENYLKYKFSYDCTKELGIIYTEKILKENNLGKEFDKIKTFRKKDDLCDAFLHGYKQLFRTDT